MSYERELYATLRTEGVPPDVLNVWVRKARGALFVEILLDPLSVRYWVECAFQR